MSDKYSIAFPFRQGSNGGFLLTNSRVNAEGKIRFLLSFILGERLFYPVYGQLVALLEQTTTEDYRGLGAVVLMKLRGAISNYIPYIDIEFVAIDRRSDHELYVVVGWKEGAENVVNKTFWKTSLPAQV